MRASAEAFAGEVGHILTGNAVGGAEVVHCSGLRIQAAQLSVRPALWLVFFGL